MAAWRYTFRYRSIRKVVQGRDLSFPEAGTCCLIWANLFLSLCVLLDTAFFVPATRWEDRFAASLVRILFAGCVCMISGLLFHISQPQVPLARALPVRLFLWAMSGFT